AGATKLLPPVKNLDPGAGVHPTAIAAVTRQCDACAESGAACNQALHAENEMWCKKLYTQHLIANGQLMFVQMEDEQSTSRIGRFMRRTNLDALPQLWNVLKGDLSVVGNRPLPPSENTGTASGEYALHAKAPVDVTGMWQLPYRNGQITTKEERLHNQPDYAKRYGLLFMLKYILRTFPALIQKENG
ncbi:MAG TPA: sugar transferase, partial [Flavisolibacter sp.]|nr:sugar transferase [Flavisolibacter sp.]